MKTKKRMTQVGGKIRLAIALAAFALVAPTTLLAQLPESGTAVPALSVFDDIMQDFMDTNAIRAGVLGISKDDCIVYHRGFGWKDDAQTQPLPPDALFRIASVTKPLTSSGIRELITAGAFALNDFVFDLGQPGGGILSITPFPSLGDARLADITVEDLLRHEGGWDRSVAGDLTYMEIQIASDMGIASPPGRLNTVRWILGQPLENDPGTTYAYSNIGFLVLGLILEQESGTDYLSYLHSTVFDGLSHDFELGRTFVADRNPREPWYDHIFTAPNVYDPGGTWVRRPEGAWDHEARVGQGAVISSTVPLLQFLERRYISGPSIGALKTGNITRNHTGSLSGTNSLARQRSNGVNYVVLFNKSPYTGSSYSGQIRTIIDAALVDGMFDGLDCVCCLNSASGDWQQYP